MHAPTHFMSVYNLLYRYHSMYKRTPFFQALTKARRANEARRYVLCEESRTSGAGPFSFDSSGSGMHGGGGRTHFSQTNQHLQSTPTRWRVLADDENVHAVQVAWKNSAGKFTLMERQKVPEVRYGNVDSNDSCIGLIAVRWTL